MPKHSSPHSRRSGDHSASGDDVTQEFWGDSAGWEPTARRHRGSDERAGATTVSPIESERVDNGVDDRSDQRADNHLDNPEMTDDEWDDGFDDWSPEPTPASTPPRFGIDPLLARFGGLAIVLTLLVPVIIGFTSDDSEAVRSVAPVVEIAGAASASIDIAPAPTDAAAAPTAPALTAPAPTAAVPVSATPAPTTTPAPATAESAPTAAAPDSTSAPTTAVELSAAQTCAIEYEIVDGDFWIRIADESGTALADLLALNDATVSTALFAGRSICLPVGATVPSPPPAPTTAAPTPSTTQARAATPSTTQTRATPTATTPRTAAAPTPSTTPATTAPPRPVSNASADEVQAIIRAVWPDGLEERALEIAWRESNYKANAKNSCCYGVFQIHWGAHQSWLRGIGVTSAAQLYDPTTNARAALVLYERSGGWGPWGG